MSKGKRRSHLNSLDIYKPHPPTYFVTSICQADAQLYNIIALFTDLEKALIFCICLEDDIINIKTKLYVKQELIILLDNNLLRARLLFKFLIDFKKFKQDNSYYLISVYEC